MRFPVSTTPSESQRLNQVPFEEGALADVAPDHLLRLVPGMLHDVALVGPGRLSSSGARPAAKTTNTALKLAGKFGSYFDGALSTAGKMLENEVRLVAAKRSVRFSDKWNEFMDARGLPAPTRSIPPNFSLPLLTAAVLEEDDELQDTWARLLVNAGDASTNMELRTAYVEILRGMSSFDALNLSVMAKATLDFRGEVAIPILETCNLPNSAKGLNEAAGAGEPLSEAVGISINNLNRLGCIASASSTFGGRPIFAFATVTSMGLALYRACS